MAYGIISDTHCHNWSAFSSVNEDGVNNRLRIILDEIERAAKMVKDRGGKFLFHAGDLFHVRGSIAPSVFNPTLEAFKRIVESGITPVIICGNHDAEFRHANNLGSAVAAFENLGCIIVNGPQIVTIDEHHDVLCMPWVADVDAFYASIKKMVETMGKSRFDLICHVALDGVFSYLAPKSVADPTKIYMAAGSRLRHIFAGHLHNHKQWSVDGMSMICSVGAIAQHNWGDVGSKAGFMIVDDREDAGEGIEFFASHAPEFIKITGEMSEEQVMLECDGNYVRAVVNMTEGDAKRFREMLSEAGALGVTMICHPPIETRADRIEISATENIVTIVGKYVAERVDKRIAEEVATAAQEILAETEEGK